MAKNPAPTFGLLHRLATRLASSPSPTAHAPMHPWRLRLLALLGMITSVILVAEAVLTWSQCSMSMIHCGTEMGVDQTMPAAL